MFEMFSEIWKDLLGLFGRGDDGCLVGCVCICFSCRRIHFKHPKLNVT